VARIRSIKPEFWDSESVGHASLRARLMFIAMWNWADDYGIGDATPIRLIGFAFPNDELAVADFPPLREEISERFGVVFYKHEGRPYYYVPSWEKHQRTEKRAKQRIPFPHDIENVEMTDVSIKVAENPPPSSGKSGAGTGEQGNRGTGEETPLSNKSDDLKINTENFDQFWALYPRREGKGQARTALKKALKKTDLPTILKAVDEYASWLRAENKERTYMAMPASWLNGERWTDERTGRDESAPRKFTSADDLELPPDGLTPEQYRKWVAERRTA